MKLTNREKVLVAITVTIGIITLYYQFILSTQISNIGKLNVEIDKRKIKLNKLSMLNENNLNDRLVKIEASLKNSNDELPDNKDIENFLIKLDDIISSTGVTFMEVNLTNSIDNKTQNQQTVSITQEQKQQGSNGDSAYVKIPIIIKVSGNYEKISAFIKGIQDLKRINSINTVDILKNKDSDNLTLTMDVIIYSVKNTGGSYLNTMLVKGKSDPFKSLINIQTQQNNQQGLLKPDINKIITDSVDSITKTSANQNNGQISSEKNIQQNTNTNASGGKISQ
ncbi:type 4a pilus biogenesis protein PilO [Aceticella autotrophica]|uniref:Type 4a pilus biogenesis protein PilO n=1 Tax=Aceticella autotrophica TaxID=2755338 RepID=A0A974Y2Y5_9THEO|nr:type 4a pilus biogenesis protein PilO [Aceticella autotrophica]QSZ26525.1 type 4a pilus biogenesis protein PilO [Aceticella autotrophica]